MHIVWMLWYTIEYIFDCIHSLYIYIYIWAIRWRVLAIVYVWAWGCRDFLLYWSRLHHRLQWDYVAAVYRHDRSCNSLLVYNRPAWHRPLWFPPACCCPAWWWLSSFLPAYLAGQYKCRSLSYLVLYLANQYCYADYSGANPHVLLNLSALIDTSLDDSSQIESLLDNFSLVDSSPVIDYPVIKATIKICNGYHP